MSGKEWFTARELAAIAKERGLKSFPKSERGVRDHATHEGWNALPRNLCRDRAAVGGGREYHRSILPGVMQEVIEARDANPVLRADHEQRRLIEEKKVALLPQSSLQDCQRDAMEARGEILVAIERYATVHGLLGRRKAILTFVRAQELHAEWMVARSKAEAGEPVTSRELMLLQRPSLLEDLEGFGLLANTLLLANDRSGKRKGKRQSERKRTGFRISARTVQRWFAIWDTIGITGLAPALSNEDDPVSDEFKAFLVYYAKPSKPAATEALKDYLKANPESSLTVEQVRYTLKRKLNDIERNVGREGLLTLRSRMAYIQRSTENLFPTTIYTADGKTFDAEVEHPRSKKAFKPEITSILDVATRKCVGFSIALKENTIAVTEALRKSCTAHGIPAVFYVDRGPGYKNKVFDGDVNGMMGRLGITKMHALPYNSQAKGIIERFNGSVWNPLAERLPTFLGAKMDKEAAKLAHKVTRSEIKEFGSSRLLPTWDDFRAMCVEAIAEYNARPHGGLPRYRDEKTGAYRHYSPDEFWMLHVKDGFEPVPVDADEMDDLFRPSIVRKVRRGFIFWKNNSYHHRILEAHHNEWVLVGYDFDDPFRVWVREIDRDRRQPGRLLCVANWDSNKRDYIPMSVQQQVEETRTQRRLKRHDDKGRDIREEFIAPYIIDQPAVEPMPMIDPVPSAEPVPVSGHAGPVLVIDNGGNSVTGARSAGPMIRSKQDLARFALTNPDNLTSSQVRVLRDCLNRHTEIELFLLDGIDVDALTEIVRAAA